MFSRPKRTATAFLLTAVLTAAILSVAMRPVRSAVRPGNEAARIQSHLAGAEHELRSADVRALSPVQRLARREQIARLHEYRLRGTFPHNHDFEGGRAPYFADRHGTLCAMAYLIEASGRSDIVNAVSVRSNNARVTELAADPVLGPVLVAWLKDSGLTVAEAQRVQPAYEYQVDEEPRVSTAYAVGSGALGAVNLVSIAVNGGRATGGRGPAWTSPVGLVMGGGQMALGAAALGDGGERRVLGIANVVVGFTSLLVSALTLRSSTKDSSTSLKETQSFSVRPSIHTHATAGPGLAIQARF